jgi:hypothetical protein
MIKEGTTGSAFIDEIYGEAYVAARLSEAILSLQKQKDIVPYDDDGIGLTENKMREVFNECIERGIITQHAFNADGERTGGYEITSPKASTIPSATKESRVYSGTYFKYFKRVAMHKSVINGVALY